MLVLMDEFIRAVTRPEFAARDAHVAGKTTDGNAVLRYGEFLGKTDSAQSFSGNLAGARAQARIKTSKDSDKNQFRRRVTPERPRSTGMTMVPNG